MYWNLNKKHSKTFIHTITHTHSNIDIQIDKNIHIQRWNTHTYTFTNLKRRTCINLSSFIYCRTKNLCRQNFTLHEKNTKRVQLANNYSNTSVHHKFKFWSTLQSRYKFLKDSSSAWSSMVWILASPCSTSSMASERHSGSRILAGCSCSGRPTW